MLKLSCSYESVRFVLVKIWTEWVTNCYILCNFQFLTMFNTTVGAGAARAGAASCYGSGSDQKMRLLAAPALAPQHWSYSRKLWSCGATTVPRFWIDPTKGTMKWAFLRYQTMLRSRIIWCGPRLWKTKMMLLWFTILSFGDIHTVVRN
jgi:hypothetical protein